AGQALLLWADGHLVRVSLKDTDKPQIVETLSILDGGARVTAACMLAGKSTLLVGDSTGRVRGWFLARPDKRPRESGDSFNLVLGHEIPGAGAAVTALDRSSRNRLFAAGYADGRVRIYHMTSQKRLADLKSGSDKPILAVALSPKNDLLFAQSEAG